MKAGLNPDHLRNEWKRLDEIPFDAAYRIMATLHSGPADEHVIFLKGAPEEVMAVAGVDARLWEQRIAQAAAHCERLVGFAMRRLPATKARITFRTEERRVGKA